MAENSKKYNENDVEEAVKAVNEGRMSLREAEQSFNVPKSTIDRRSKGGLSPIAAQTVLSQSTELLIVELIGHLSDIGFGLDKKLFLSLIDEYLKKTNQLDLFVNGSPHPNFYHRFISRHSHKLKTMKAQNISEIRAKSVSPDVMDEWFEKYKRIYDKHDLKNFPGNIFNCDESGFQPEQRSVRIITKKSTRNPYKLAANNPKATYTVLVCCNAIGEYLPLNFILKGKHLYSNYCVNGPPGAAYDTSESSWMEGEQLYKWFKDSFLKFIEGSLGWKVLFFDGHHSHISLQLVNLALENRVVLIVLSPHTTHLLQPLDGPIFRKVKQTWKDVLEEHFRASNTRTILKSNFSELMRTVYRNCAFDIITAISAFENCGIYPLNRSKISIEKTNISVTFSSTPISKQVENSPLSTSSPQSSSQCTSFVCTPRTMTRTPLSTRDTNSKIANLESNLKFFENQVSFVAQNLKDSVRF